MNVSRLKFGKQLTFRPRYILQQVVALRHSSLRIHYERLVLASGVSRVLCTRACAILALDPRLPFTTDLRHVMTLHVVDHAANGIRLCKGAC